MIPSKLIWTGAAAAAAVLSAGAVMLLRPETGTLTLPEIRVQNVTEPAETVQHAAATLPVPENAYLLRLSGDTLSVYEEGSKEPLAQYELPADWLPDYDRTVLEYGLRVDSKEELRQLIEDYAS